MGIQKCEQLMATAHTVGLLAATKPVCDRAKQIIVNPILLGLPIGQLRMELRPKKPLSLLDGITPVRKQDDHMDIDSDDEFDAPQTFRQLEDESDDDRFSGFAESEGEGGEGEGESEGESESEEQDPF